MTVTPVKRNYFNTLCFSTKNASKGYVNLDFSKLVAQSFIVNVKVTNLDSGLRVLILGFFPGPTAALLKRVKVLFCAICKY